jgi:hypothetical protein
MVFKFCLYLKKKEEKNGAISPVKALNGAYSFGPLKSQLLSYLHFLISIFELSARKTKSDC